MNIEPKTQYKVETFFLDDKKEVAAYEAVLNNPMTQILKKETILIKEKEQDYNDDGRLIASRELTRPQWVVEYVLTELPKPKKDKK